MADFDSLKKSLAFTDADVMRLSEFASEVRQFLPAVVERFYVDLLRDPIARSVFTGGESQIARQRSLLTDWLNQLFEGTYDAAYYEKRFRIGVAHVAVGLPQHYMVIGIGMIWAELERLTRASSLRHIHEKLGSFHKLLMMDLAIMLESFKDSYSFQVRAVERQAVAEKLTRAEHLAEIGQLAASLAHEIKNPLAGISGAIQVIREGMPANNPHRPIISEILTQIDRLDETVKDLLLYARPRPLRTRLFTLEDTIQRVLRVLQEEPALQNIRIDHTPSPDGGWVEADEGLLDQLLINLIINAAHACERKGLVRLAVSANGEFVSLIVSDNGRGMSAEIRDRAFEPFFTTKAKGTGLGLAICRRIVDAHNGRIRLESETGRGTTVIVELPKTRVGA